MGKPRAARRQPIVPSSEDEGDARDSPPPLKRPKRGTLTSTLQDGVGGDSKPQRPLPQRASSARTKATPKSPSKSPAKSKPIHKPITSFFSNVPPPSSTRPSSSPEKPPAITPIEEVDDILDSSGDERPAKRPTALPVRKRGRDAPTSSAEALLKPSHKFLRTANGVRNTPPPTQSAGPGNLDTRPWNEKYGPVSVDELAVHKKKVADVQSWLSDVFSGSRRKRLLLLKGPAGSGKTTVMTLLGKELGLDIHEWKNPTGASYSAEGFVSVTAQFEDFVGRTGAFGSLAFDGQTPVQAPSKPAAPSRQKQLILVEEFPNTFARASSALQSFRAAILNYLATNTPSASDVFTGKVDPNQPVTPIVMIISETLLSTNTAAADSFTAHRLLGPEILSHPGTFVIEFNPIAPTFMTKALELVVMKEARKSGRKMSVGPRVIQRLSELGDVRSAVSSLEFLCIRGDKDGDWGGKITFSKKKASKDTPMTKMEQESLEMVTQRESTLGIFHAVGRVVYNKRLPEDPRAPVPQPPHWFPERRRPKASEVQLESLIDELGTDTQTFIAALHENYVLSCEGTDEEETMDAIDGCIESLSDADLLSPDRFSNSGFVKRNFQGTSSDTLRQDEMSFQACVRGLLYSLPSPVKRINPPPGVMGIKGKAASKGSAYVMYYPASLRIWRQQEEIGGLIDLWISRIQQGKLLSSKSTISKPVVTGTGGVDTWRRSTAFDPEKASSSAASKKDENTDSLPVLLGSGGSARHEMLLERLPYLARILEKKSLPSAATAATIRELRKLTTFTGTSTSTSVPNDQDDDAEDEPLENEQWATDRPGPDTPRKKTRNKIMSKTSTGEALTGIVEKEVKGLVLSDDDIED